MLLSEKYDSSKLMFHKAPTIILLTNHDMDPSKQSLNRNLF